MGYISGLKTFRYLRDQSYYASLFPAEASFANAKPKVAMLGAPGVGKHTMGRQVSLEMRLPLININDEINRIKDRAEFAQIYKRYSGSSLNKELLAQAQAKKELDPQLVELKLLRSAYKATDGFVLEDFPQTLAQAERLYKMIPDLSLVVNLDMSDEIIMERVAHAMSCTNCGKNYNGAHFAVNGKEITPVLPQNGHICDDCGGKVVALDDATKKAWQGKIDQYRKNIEPVLNFFDKYGLLTHFDPVYGEGDRERLAGRIRGQMKYITNN